MTTLPAWVPPLLLLEKHGGDWGRYLQALYEGFRADFVHSAPTFRGLRVGLTRANPIEGKEPTFWHLISEGDIEEDRTPNMRRCERVRWPRPVIDYCDELGVKVWTEARSKRGGGQEARVHIWLECADYLVVLTDRRTYTLFWTAFPVEGEHTRRKYQQRFEKNAGVVVKAVR